MLTMMALPSNKWRSRTTFACGLLLWWLLVTLTADPVGGFLFPDLGRGKGRAKRSVSHYKIAVLLEPPFMYTNGSGYVPELMQTIADVYSQLHQDNNRIPFDIVPVDVWHQLAEKAEHRHRKQVAFGLIPPTVLLSDEPWKDWSMSTAIVWTSLKLLVPVRNEQLQEAVTNTTRDHRTRYSCDTMLVMRDSTEDRVLSKRSTFHRRPSTTLLKVDTLNDARLFAQNVDRRTAIVTDAAVADTIATQQLPRLFESLCPRRVHRADLLYYGFFGTDSDTIDTLVTVVNHMANHRNILQQLNQRYFGNVVQCS